MNDFNNASTAIQQNFTKKCEAWTLEQLKSMDDLSFWLKGVAIFGLSINGIVLNLLAIRVLIMKESAQNLFNHLLITLFIADTVYLVLANMESLLNVLIASDYLYFMLFPNFIYPGRWMAMTMSIFITVAIAHERYVAVLNPIKHRIQEKSAKFRWRRLGKYVITSVVLAVLLNLPHAFESRFRWKDMRNYTKEKEKDAIKFKYLDTYYMTKDAESSYVHRSHAYEGDTMEPIIDWSGISWNWEYNFYYYNLSKLLLWGLLPMALLIFFNLKVYFGIESTKSILTSKEKQRRSQQEKKLSIIMIIIVFVFILCHSLRTFNWCYVFMLLNTHKDCNNEFHTGRNDESLLVQAFHAPWMELCWEVSDILVVFNSSVNMIIYCGVSAQFRQQLVQLFKRLLFKIRCIKSQTEMKNNAISESMRMI